MNEHQIQNIKDIKILWPYIDFERKLEWIDRAQPWFDNDFITTVLVLSGQISLEKQCK